jgi:hypothetical protein
MEGGEQQSRQQHRKGVGVAVIGKLPRSEQTAIRSPFGQRVGDRERDERDGDAEPAPNGTLRKNRHANAIARSSSPPCVRGRNQRVESDECNEGAAEDLAVALDRTVCR